jgi:hypothetical protein
VRSLLTCLVGAAIAIAPPLVAGALGRARSHPQAMLAQRGPSPITVVLLRDGATAMPGEDDARQLRSSLLERGDLEWVDVPPFVGDDAEWHALIDCVRSEYGAFDVVIVDTPPEQGDYIGVTVGGAPSLLGFDDSVTGVAPWNGHVIPRAMVFVFQTPDTTARALCETASHEIGHALGLDHSRDCSDLMSYESCGIKHFRDEAAACGEWDARTCANGHDEQSSANELARRLGRRAAV